VADLVPEANNPHDANAVRVDIDGLTVGYLDREDAVAFRKQLRRVIEVGRPIKCEARVRRKDHEGNRTYYDVYLEADLGD
jgi:sRNA-binding protein